jgi:hypothetical protein
MRSFGLMAAAGILLSMAGCSEPSSSTMLQMRAESSLGSAQPCQGTVRTENLPNGVRVLVPESALFLVGQTAISACGQYLLVGIVEAMLDPRIMQIVVEPSADINAPDAYVARERTGVLRQRLSNAGFVPGQPPVAVQPNPASSTHTWGVALEVTNGS